MASKNCLALPLGQMRNTLQLKQARVKGTQFRLQDSGKYETRGTVFLCEATWARLCIGTSFWACSFLPRLQPRELHVRPSSAAVVRALGNGCNSFDMTSLPESHETVSARKARVPRAGYAREAVHALSRGTRCN